MKRRAFTLIELLLVISILVMLTSAAIMSIDVIPRNKFVEAKEQLKSFVLYHKYKSMYDQKPYTIQIDSEQHIFTDLLTAAPNLEYVTNDLVILGSDRTNIVFFNDGCSDGVEIMIKNIEGTITNSLFINEIGMVQYRESHKPQTQQQLPADE
jgi:prepilin-type N-terminal cleavage/methylation domain-containing protein